MWSLFSTSKKSQAVEALPLYLYNTESKSLETFISIKPGAVTMYSCGPTVYDYVHIGNLRAYVMVDILKRTLEYNHFVVKNTINLTDFGHLTDDGDAGDDKMMKGLAREGMPVTLEAMRKLSNRYIEAFKKDLNDLQIDKPTQFSRASDFVFQQIQLIKTLEEKGYTYETTDGIYFDISKFPKYGRLGNINLAELKSGARVETNSEKRHPADFAVWKKGDLGWNSRWGKGFPGWHIECSAMAIATLGKQIDIHTGGIDHIAVHHNAEISQCECATGKKFVNYWLHNEFITINNSKISKSLGNAINLHHLQEAGYNGDDYRYWLLTAHYRSPVNFSLEALKASKQALFRLKRHIYEDYKAQATTVVPAYLKRFHTYINDDLNTPQAIALLWEISKDNQLTTGEKYATIKHIDGILQIGLSQPLAKAVRSLGVISTDKIPTNIQIMINERELARTAHNWQEADRLREELKYQGYEIEDSNEGPKISKV